MSEILARGPNFVYAKEFVLQRIGPDGWARVLGRMPPEAAAVWKKNFIAVDSYPLEIFKALAPAVAEELGESWERENEEMYVHIAERSINVLYKLFFSLTKPSVVIGNYPLLWKRFFTAGRVEVPESEREHAEIRFELPEPFLDWLPSAVAGYSRKAVEMAGGRQLATREVERLRIGDGSWRVSYQLTWREGA